jgi:DNA repair photolyase
VRPRPLSNPPNPWERTTVEWLREDGVDPATSPVQVFEDASRTILAHNDSPDIGFRWSVNPYRGCMHACAYCVAGDTPILLADGRTRRMADVRPGDEIYGTERRGFYRRYVRTRVIDHWRVVKPAWRMRLDDGTELVASADHRFLTRRGWKYVTGAQQGREQRPHLTTASRVLGTGRFAEPPADDEDYRRGYVAGMVRGDALLATYTYDGGRRAREVQHHFRLALVDLEALHRTRRYLAGFSVPTHEFAFAAAVGDRLAMTGIRTHARGGVERVRELIAFPATTDRQWAKGFLAGIFDAEGSCSRGILRISNEDPEILGQTLACLATLGFDAVLERPRVNGVRNIRLRGGLPERLRFFHTTDPAITRKRDIERTALKGRAARVVSVEALGLELPLYDMTTGTGDFIANGVVSHNCYARPSHEYLSFGAGTDFDTKIVVKRDAPALLREAFDRRSWKGELVMFSGVTDCYQPLEASLKLTRGCLEVCAAYRNPMSLITKAPLVERDIDVLQELGRVTSAPVNISIPFWNAERARAIEPFVATPQRRVRTIEALAKAGIRVGVMVAPVIPGLNDQDIADVLAAARDAGAVHAGYVLLRLPGSVKSVFEERVRERLPLTADKILHRIRETRGGRLYDARFGARQTGEGHYADTIATLFDAVSRRLGYGEWPDDGHADTFRRPPKGGDQLTLF